MEKLYEENLRPTSAYEFRMKHKKHIILRHYQCLPHTISGRRAFLLAPFFFFSSGFPGYVATK